MNEGQISEHPVEVLTSDQIIDTNGAGDAFVGGFLAMFVQVRESSKNYLGPKLRNHYFDNIGPETIKGTVYIISSTSPPMMRVEYPIHNGTLYTFT